MTPINPVTPNFLHTKPPITHWRKLTEYIAMRCKQVNDEHSMPFIPIGPMLYYSKKLDWNVFFLVLMGAIHTEFYRKERWINGYSIVHDGQVFATQEAGVVSFLGYIQDHPSIIDDVIYNESIKEYHAFMKWIKDGKPFDPEPAYPEPAYPEPAYPELPKNPHKEPIKAPGSWKQTLHAIVTVLLSVWFLVDWFVPMPDATKSAIKAVLTAISQMTL